ncbi:HEPN domain-containing protein [Pseudoalteromonas sp. S1608]|uniref:HEPN domain-containing protein n=1 Tax=Pseudoalteromonas sp. S1608 TaxID=579504 RepID=UPI00110B3ED6|nr:HEPN domain-containing protein [Pseudoalteromonas sp. S1608]TMP75025.1 hypothetical protein CWB75_08010 [Pseudoalteromonas sp. S1608]
MNNYKVEYLSVINSKETFCKSISSFNNLLQSYDNVSINGNKIDFEGTKFEYDVQFGEIQEDSQRFFHIKLKCKNKANLDKFKLLLKSVRTLLTKASEKPPEILWDDLSSELANKAYPAVHEIENMMRKLITKFMLTTIGLAWTKDAVPKEVSESIKTKKSSTSQNYLYEADFIQLSNFLFKEYSTANSRKLVEKLGTVKDINELELTELQELVPQSNWERYFSPIVDCKSEYLQTRWEKLYELRCMVAHNKFLSADDYDEICRVTKEVKDKITQAIENLDKVHVSEEQKEDVAENIASSMNSLYGEFIRSWNMVQELLVHLYSMSLNGDEDFYLNKKQMMNARALVKPMIAKGVLPKEFGPNIFELNALRNAVVHHSDLKISENSFYDYLGMLDRIKSELIHIVENYRP